MRDNGLVIVTICGAAAIVFVLIYALVNRRQPEVAGAQSADDKSNGTNDKAMPE